MKESLAGALVNLIDALGILGGSGGRAQVIRTNFATTHRTLQQQFVQVVIIPVLKQLAHDYEQGYFDGRNEESCKLAVKMLAAVTEDDLYLPFR